MDDHRLPKKILFGWLPQRCPAHGTRMRWRDRVRKDLKKFNIDERRWYQLAQDRSGWRRSCRTGLEDVTGQRMRGEEGHVWKTILRTVVAVQLQISHTSVVCVREHSD